MLKSHAVVTLVGIATVLDAVPAIAKAPPCARDEMSIADERGGGRKICLKKSEWRKAKAICYKLPLKAGKHVGPIGCVCQDGNSVGACGD